METDTKATNDAEQLDPSIFRDQEGPVPRGEARRIAAEGKPRYFDAFGHARAQKLHNRGIWTDLGLIYGGLQIRLRPMFAHAVTVKREDTETHLRITRGLADDDPLPADANIEINRASVNMAITSANGMVNVSTQGLDPDDPDAEALGDAFARMLRVAQGERGLKARMVVHEEDGLVLVELTGRQRTDQDRLKSDPDGVEAVATREFFYPLLEVSMPFLATLVRHVRGLQKVKEEELNRLGEGFVFGQHVRQGWGD